MNASNRKLTGTFSGHGFDTDRLSAASYHAARPVSSELTSIQAQTNTKPHTNKKPIEQLNVLFMDYEMALEAAASAQKDVVVLIRAHLRGDGSLPHEQLQAAANDLWYCAARKKARLEEFYVQHVR